MDSYKIFEGPSEINGQPIIAVVTHSTSNRKTGDTAQLWILPANIKPNAAVKTGDDEAVCGNCKHRPLIAKKTNRKACYVRTFQAPRSIFEAAQRGSYMKITPAAANHEIKRHGLKLRLGAWGDPAALPQWVIEGLARDLEVLGYTHQWRNDKFSWLKRWCMASVDTFKEYCRAQAAGWRCFFNCADDEEYERTVALHEVNACPASKEMGANMTCSECMACDGKRGPGDYRANVIIKQH